MRHPQFIIATYPRTGSTLLCDCLGQHPKIREAMEIFHERHTSEDFREQWRKEKFLELYGMAQENMSRLGSNGQEVLDFDRFDFLPFVRSLVEHFNGFKLIYHQVPVNANLWSYFLEEVKPKVVFMQRGFLEACVSLFLSIRTGVWQRYHPHDPIPEPAISISVTDLQEFYRIFYQPELEYREKFSSLESMTVDYNELQQDYQGTMKVVQEFLELSPIEVHLRIYKKTTKPVQDLISNYDELMNLLDGESAEKYVEKLMASSRNVKFI